MGGEAIANGDDVADFAGPASAWSKQAIDTFGRLDVVVNNAGFLRDRMFVSTSEEEWDAVIRVHLKGHFCVARHACAYWRDQSKAGASRRRPHHQHELRRRPAGQRRPERPTRPPRPASRR